MESLLGTNCRPRNVCLPLEILRKRPLRCWYSWYAHLNNTEVWKLLEKWRSSSRYLTQLSLGEILQEVSSTACLHHFIFQDKRSEDRSTERNEKGQCVEGVCGIYVNNQASPTRVRDLGTNLAGVCPRMRSSTFPDISLESSEFHSLFPLIIFISLLKLPLSQFEWPKISSQFLSPAPSPTPGPAFSTGDIY